MTRHACPALPLVKLLACLLGGCATAAAAHPARPLDALEIAALAGQPYLSPANQPFEMAARVTVSARDKGGPAAATQRRQGATARAYRGLPAAASPTPAQPALPAASSLINPLTTGDLSQSWATMAADGRPFLQAVGHGHFNAEATASWTTRVTVPAGAARELVLRAVIPMATLAGTTEPQAVARWRAGLRAQLLVQGQPVWSTEAVRSVVAPRVRQGRLLQTVALLQSGAALDGPVDGDDPAPPRGGLFPAATGATEADLASGPHTVHLSLGRHAGGSVVDVSMVLRGAAATAPAAADGSDPRCRLDRAAARWFCSRSAVTVDGHAGEPPRLYLLP